MISLLKKIFGSKAIDLSQLLKNGAVIIDVRSKSEFATGHAKDSLNLPLEQIAVKVDTLKHHNHIIVCCRSGNRSGMAQRILKSKGIKNVTNGGSWQNVNNYIS